MHMEWECKSRIESRMSCLRYLWCTYSSVCVYIGSSVVIAGKVPVMHRYCTMRRRALANSHACVSWNGNGNVERIENTLQ